MSKNQDTQSASDQPLLDEFRSFQEQAVIEVADQGLASLSQMVNSGSIDVSPGFQRRDRWDQDRQSRLIESFLLNIPVPPVYLAEDAKQIGSYAVIDGKQRLTAIGQFLSSEFALRGLTTFKSLNNLRFDSLPAGIRSALGMKSLRVITLLRQSDEQLKHEVFLRLNTGGEVLNPQEIRNVAYHGPLNQAIYRAAENTFLRGQFKATSKNSPAYKSMQDAELVLRFITLKNTWKSYSGSLRTAMDDYMSNHRNMPAAEIHEFECEFSKCIENASHIFGGHAFKRPGRDQALAGMWDAQMIALSSLNDGTLRKLRDSPALAQAASDSLFEDNRFDEAVRQATNTPDRLKYRIQRMQSALMEVAAS